MKTTEAAYKELQKAFTFFNEKLFDNKLPDCLITFQRKNRTYGYFSPTRFIHKGGNTIDEIAMNPSYFSVVPIERILQVIVHEQCHQFMEHFGTPGRRGYHNKAWGDKMESVGLMPSNTGEPGGKKTGDQMMDYIIEGGPFQRCLDEFLASGFNLSWSDRFPPIEKVRAMVEEQGIDALREKLEDWGITVDENEEISPALLESQQTRAKFTCPSCQANAWGKPSLNILCIDCDMPLIEAS